jgi:hypothetical protein
MLYMPKHSRSRTKLVPQSMSPREKQSLEVMEDSNLPEQKEVPVLPELDMEIECPRCNEIMELCSSFDELVYSCETCSFLLKCL